MILVKSPRTGERVKASVTRFLTRELKLAVYEQKSRVVKTMTVSSWDFPSEERNCDGPTKPSPTSSTRSRNSPDGAGVSQWPIGSTGSRVTFEAG